MGSGQNKVRFRVYRVACYLKRGHISTSVRVSTILAGSEQTRDLGRKNRMREGPWAGGSCVFLSSLHALT